RRLKVQIHGVAVHQGHISVAQAPADEVQGRHAVDNGGGGAHGDEGVHVGGEVEQGFEAHPEILLVDDQRGQGEQKQGEGVHHGVLLPQKAGGDGPAHHVPHGQVEQGDEEDQGGDEPQLHVLLILFHGLGGGAGLGGLAAGFTLLGQGGAVA